MKKSGFLTIMMAVVIAAAMTACGGNSKKVSIEEARIALNQQIELIYQDSTLSEAEADAAVFELFSETYAEHKSDSLGLSLFAAMITMTEDMELIEKLYQESDTLILNNEAVKTKMAAVANMAKTAAGCSYKEITGEDAISGEPLALSQFVGKSGKPVLVDFWASWCRPCRHCIKEHLINIYGEGNIDIVGVAVWEKSVDDTRKAMEELGITWPVIFTGDREDSPTIEYGVLGIPTLVLISPEGTILSRGYDIEEVLKAL